MNESKHTPGPWNYNGPYVWSPKHGDVAHVWAAMSDEGEANARLVAAAPDLLAACEALVKRSRACFEACSYDVLDQAEAAIAKAKGETA